MNSLSWRYGGLPESRLALRYLSSRDHPAPPHPQTTSWEHVVLMDYGSYETGGTTLNRNKLLVGMKLGIVKWTLFTCLRLSPALGVTRFTHSELPSSQTTYSAAERVSMLHTDAYNSLMDHLVPIAARFCQFHYFLTNWSGFANRWIAAN